MFGETGGVAGVRTRNLAGLLRRLHLDGPHSRAALTAATGLNRSTIADLVGELVRGGLATERAADPAGRAGRPSPVVAASPDVVAVAANPEVDALDIAAIGLDRRMRRREHIEVDHLLTPAETAQLIAQRLSTWRADGRAAARFVSVAVAVPGLVRAADGLVRDAPHLHWTDVPLRDLVADATGLPVAVGNDAGMGMLAEHLFGAGRGVRDLVYLNGGSSGIGGGVLIDGMPVAGAGGYAGEFGQNRPGIHNDADRRAVGGTLEDEVSRARLLAVAGLDGADEPTLAAALRAAGPAARSEMARQRRILATALADAVNVLNPAVVVLGGFLATIAAVDLNALTADVRAQAMPASAEGLDIRVAALADEGLLMGAGEAAFADLLRDPPAFAPR